MLQSRMWTPVARMKQMKFCSFSKIFIRCCTMSQIRQNRDTPTKVYNISADVENCVSAAMKQIQLGNVIAIPTDTIYGLAVDAENEEAIEKLYEIKDRHTSKAVAICVHDVGCLNQWGHVEHLPTNMLHELFPGPVTVVVKRTSNLNNRLNPDHENIAIRIPAYNFVQRLTTALQKPIALTSANKSGDLSSVTIEEFTHLWPSLDAVFDGGLTGSDRAGSTILDLSVNGKYTILREGGYLDFYLKVLTEYGFKPI